MLFYMLCARGEGAGGIEYNPAPLPIPVRAKMSTQPGSVAHAPVYGSTWESVCVRSIVKLSCNITCQRRHMLLLLLLLLLLLCLYVGWCPTGCSQGQDDALWSDDDSGDEGATDFRAAQAILESALPELDDGEEWATDSEEEFE